MTTTVYAGNQCVLATSVQKPGISLYAWQATLRYLHACNSAEATF